jgi:signal transduction histidine kinase
MKTRRSWWLIYTACVIAGVAALAGVTTMAMRLERAEITARAEAARQESLRLALWRMDSWVAPQLAREAARTFFEYQAFRPEDQAYTKTLTQIDAGEVLTPSPLLGFESEYFKLHFQVAPDGSFTSPQAPSGEWGAVACGEFLPETALLGNRAVLDDVRDSLGPNLLAQCVPAESNEPPAQAAAPDIPWIDQVQKAAPQQVAEAQQLRTDQELSQRQRAYQLNTNLPQPLVSGAAQAASGTTVGGLVPIWVSNGEERTLIFARQVSRPEGDYYQGFLCDWTALEAALLGEIRDLFETAALVPVAPEQERGAGGTMLATIPVSLEVPAVTGLAPAFFSPARSGLALTWLLLLAAAVAIAITLRASIDYGLKRSRFASAVTHELRTPLTTFRMYTEMLADGMVQDDGQKQSYMETLKDESGRLTTLVENVLSYARLEEGRWTSHARAVPVAELIERLQPRLERRTAESGTRLDVVNDDGAVVLHTDVEAVGQVLYNLVDNACKYARTDGRHAIELTCRADEGHVVIAVRDHGPGVPARQERSLFVAFDRGEHGESDQPGIGLGLALSAGLARDLGGRLGYRAAPGGGACFELMLPREES